MKNILLINLSLFLSFTISAQTFNTSLNNQNSQFQKIIKDVTYFKVDQSTEIDGSKYYYKNPQEAVINLIDGYQPIRMKANYNIIDETIEVESDKKILNIKPGKVNFIAFKDANFIVFQGNFYKEITKNSNFSLIRAVILKTIEPEYKVGIVEKPNLRFKRDDEIYIQQGEKKRMIKISKKSIILLFDNSKASLVKKFMKSNKISIRKDADLKLLFDNFKNDLKDIR